MKTHILLLTDEEMNTIVAGALAKRGEPNWVVELVGFLREIFVKFFGGETTGKGKPGPARL